MKRLRNRHNWIWVECDLYSIVLSDYFPLFLKTDHPNGVRKGIKKRLRINEFLKILIASH